MPSTFSPARAFLQAILHEPDDDTHRLVYADWLDDHGDPRGEFIRVQCELDRLGADDPTRQVLLERSETLQRRHSRAWAGDVDDLVSAYDYRRGFVECVRIDAVALLQHGDRLFELAPIRELHLTALSEHLPYLAACAPLRNLTSLDLICPSEDVSTLEEFFASPHLAGLTRLKVRQSSAVPRALGRSYLPFLESLDLAGSVVRADDVRHLATGRLPRLDRLGLRSTSLDESAVQVLAAAPMLGRLSALDLRYNFLPAEAAETLARSPWTARLRSLSLGSNLLGDSGVAALAATPMPSLTRLFLSQNRLQGPGVKAIARAAHRANLTHLDVDYNDLSSESLTKLAASPHLHSLQALFLRCDRIDLALRQTLIRRFGERVCRF
jgi:uncharacterized protein (TIGR02996 family)